MAVSREIQTEATLMEKGLFLVHCFRLQVTVVKISEQEELEKAGHTEHNQNPEMGAWVDVC